MFTARENMRRCIKNEGPDRYVNQYEALKFLITPLSFHNPRPKRGEPDMVNAWGVTYSYPLNVPAGFPVHFHQVLFLVLTELHHIPHLHLNPQRKKTCLALRIQKAWSLLL